VAGRRGSLPHDLLGFVDLEARPLQVLHYPLCEYLTSIVRRVLLQQSAQQIAATGDGKADRKQELIAEAAVIHGGACSRYVRAP
jgi:hypothetical protein